MEGEPATTEEKLSWIFHFAPERLMPLLRAIYRYAYWDGYSRGANAIERINDPHNFTDDDIKELVDKVYYGEIEA